MKEMRFLFRSVVVLITLLPGLSDLWAQSRFDLDFAGDCGRRIGGPPGAAYRAAVDCTLTPSNTSDGARAWSLSIGAAGLSITDITTDGTAVEALLDGGFVLAELTTGAGNEGAVCAVVLSYLNTSRTLPAAGTTSVARVTLAGSFPAQDTCTTGRVFYVDGRTGSGLPVENVVSVRGTRIVPALGDCAIELCGQAVAFDFELSGACGQTFSGPEGASVGALLDCVLRPRSNPSGVGAQGWSMSMAADGARIADITTEGTVSAAVSDNPPGLRNNGFEKSELTVGPGNEGAVSSVVLSFTVPVTLPPLVPSVVARIRVEGVAPAIGACRTARVYYVDGLTGSGQPVLNRVTHQIRSVFPALEECALEICGSGANWTTYDCNDDGVMDISDARCHLNYLFLGAAPPPCDPALDFNGDGVRDISDAIAELGFLFLGREPPDRGVGCRPYAGCGASIHCE
jgi:hypothetical protein